jgi:hypothetical protein
MPLSEALAAHIAVSAAQTFWSGLTIAVAMYFAGLIPFLCIVPSFLTANFLKK